MNPLALALLAFSAPAAGQVPPDAPPAAAAPADPALKLPPPPTEPVIPAPPPTDLNSLPGPPPASALTPSAAPEPLFGYLGPFPFAPNPWLANGYSRPLAAVLADQNRGLLQSDHAFDDFIAPVSNPVLAKDPRAGTYARMLIVNNNYPGEYPYKGGNAQFYIPQVSVALTERFSLTLDKAGAVQIMPGTNHERFGALDTTFGAKWTFYRDIECQRVAAAGLMVEVPTGGTDVIQGHTGGMLTPYVTGGLTFWEYWHVLATGGMQVPAQPGRNTTFLYQSYHLDRQIDGWFYPFVELNWFQYVKDGKFAPQEFQEGDGLVNYGSQFNSWKQFVSMAVGGKMLLGECVQVGVAYEFSVFDRKGILNNRVIVDMMVRY